MFNEFKLAKKTLKYSSKALQKFNTFLSITENTKNNNQNLQPIEGNLIDNYSPDMI